MQITKETEGDVLELRMHGRLDNEAADDFLVVMDDVLRQGHHAAVLDMRQVDYVSSAGLSALVNVLKRFQAIHGVFGVASSSPQVADILELTGLAKLLICDRQSAHKQQAGGMATIEPSFRVAASDGLGLAIYDLAAPERVRCQVWGNPQWLAAGPALNARHCKVPFPADSFGLGIGAFGQDEANCRGHFGELFAAAGAVAVQPTPEGGKSDYQLASGNFVPQPYLLYGLSFTGQFSKMIRFEGSDDEPRTALSALAQQCLVHSEAVVAGMVVIAESAGLIGAKLRQSPKAAIGAPGAMFQHPEIRDWFSFTPTHVFAHSLAVIVGVVARVTSTGAAASLAPLLRPLRPNSDLYGHFHAAVFSFRPLKKRRLNLQETIFSLFDSEDLQAVLHLLNDDRPISGSGESEVISGACWVGPIGEVTGESTAT